MKNLFKSSQILIKLFNNTARNLVTRNVHITKLFQSEKIPGKEIMPSQGDGITKNIKAAVRTSDILHIIRKNNTKISICHMIEAFQSIFTLQKYESIDMSNGEIIQSLEFQMLCNRLKSQTRSLELGEIIDVLKILSYLGVPASSNIVQILLQLVTKQVNELSLQQIVFLDFLIKDFEFCPLVETLKITLPVVFEAHVKTKPNIDNVSHLTELLHYSSKKNLSISINNFFIECLMKLSNKINFKNAKSIVWSLCDLRITDNCHMPLLHKALDIIVQNKEKCSFIDIDTLLSKLAHKFSQKNFYFYHEGFFDTATKYVIENNCSFQEGVWILKKASKFSFVSIKLLDYLAKKIERCPHTLDACGIVIIFSFIGGLALADYRPHNWSAIEPVILKNSYLHLKVVERPWVKFARDLCTLDCWPFELLKIIFNLEFLEKYLSRDYNVLDYIQLLSLHQAVSLLCPWYNGPKLPDIILDKAVKLNGKNVHEYPLKQSLISGLGSERYVLSGVYTRMGHFIDHTFVIKEDFTAVPVLERNQNYSHIKLYIEDLRVPEGCKMIAILYLPPSSYCVNTKRLKGPYRLGIKTLEMIGPIVLPISSMTWSRLLDIEKVPYLIQEVKNKYNHHCKNINYL